MNTRHTQSIIKAKNVGRVDKNTEVIKPRVDKDTEVIKQCLLMIALFFKTYDLLNIIKSKSIKGGTHKKEKTDACKRQDDISHSTSKGRLLISKVKRLKKKAKKVKVIK